MEDLSLHILDIVENSLAAGADRIRIGIVEDAEKDLLSVEVSDNGKGMDAATRKEALDPFFTTKTTRRVGLGLPLLAQAAGESDGALELASEPERGTTVRATFRLSHPDLKPMGNIAETLRTILAGRPDLDLQFQYKRDAETVASFSSNPSLEKERNHDPTDN